MDFFHGITVTEPIEGVRPILEKSTAIIGVVVTGTAEAGAATTRLNQHFPLNRPVLVVNLRTAVSLASGGTLPDVLGAIADQGTPLVVVVRVEEGGDEGETETNIIGGSVNGQYTGLQALLAAEAQLGIKPRIIAVPGLDTQEVVVAAVSVAQKLRGMVYASCRGADSDTAEDATIYRGQFSARELMLIWPDVTGWEGKAIATAVGLRAAIDEKTGWHKSLSNVAFNGATGLTRDVHFDIRDSSSLAGILNADQVTTIVNMTGYRFWGNSTCSDEPLFRFETAVRTSQAIQDAIADGLAWAIDKPMTVGLVRDIVETVNAKLRSWATPGSNQRLIGGRCWFDPEQNPAEQMAAGQLVIDYDYTPCAPLEGLQLTQRITDKYYAGFGDALNA